jgi:DNA-binding transcriptional MerR regulator
LVPPAYTTSQFAARAGVTVRTLRFYDKVGLLRPSAVTPSGHRRYSDHDLIRLQQILALKFLGFGLEEIRAMLDEHPMQLQDALAVQKQMMAEKRAQIDQVIRAIEHVQAAVAAGRELDWERLIWVIRVMHAQQQKDWWKQYYSEEARRKLEARMQTYSVEQAWADARRWDEVIQGMKAAFARGADPASPEVQELAGRWLGLVQEFTMGDPAIAAGLKRMYQSPSAPYPKPYSPEEEAYIHQALRIYEQHNGEAH